jgi:hypothetical protein
MTNLQADNLIPSLSYGYTAGASYQNGNGVFGSLVLGGYDVSRFNESGISLPFASQDAAALTVGVQSIIGSNTLLGVNSFTTGSNQFLALIDSTVSELWMPGPVCDNFANALGLTYDNTTGYYLVNDTMHSQLKSNNPQFTFKIGATSYDNGNSTNVVLPYSAFDLQIGWPIYSSNQNYFPIRRAANSSQNTIGRALLQEAYLVVDFERRNFSINQATFSNPMPAEHIITINPPSTSTNSSSGLGTGAIAGIAVGCAAAVIIAALALFFFLFRRRRRQKARLAELENTQKNASASDASKGDYKPVPGEGPNMAEADGRQVVEMGVGTYTGTADAKLAPTDSLSELPTREARPTELPSPLPVFEMPGDTHYGGAHPGMSPEPSPGLQPSPHASMNSSAMGRSPISPLRHSRSPSGNTPVSAGPHPLSPQTTAGTGGAGRAISPQTTAGTGGQRRISR